MKKTSREQTKTTVKNCCQNCARAQDYTGFTDFTCSKWGMQRAEQHNCSEFMKQEERAYVKSN